MRYCAVSASNQVQTSQMTVMTCSSDKLCPFETLVISVEIQEAFNRQHNVRENKKKNIIYLLFNLTGISTPSTAGRLMISWDRILPLGLFISLCTLIHISDTCNVSDKLQLVKAMRRLADHDVIARASSFHTLNNRCLCGKMPLHVILSCNNTHLKEVSEMTHSKRFIVHERQFVIPKHSSISTTKILDLIHASLAQFT